MEEINLAVRKRDKTTKGALKRFRKQGFIPAVCYGRKDERGIPLLVKKKEFMGLWYKIKRENVMINLFINEEKPERVIIKDRQIDPLRREILHLDFYKVPLKEKIEVMVPLELKGEPVGVKEGGVVEQVLRELAVRCLPTRMPEHLEVEISNLKIGESIKVGDLSPPEGVEFLMEPESLVVGIRPPEKVEEVVPPAGKEVEEKKEPEIIRKEKKAEEEEPSSEKGKEKSHKEKNI